MHLVVDYEHDDAEDHVHYAEIELEAAELVMCLVESALAC